MAYIKMQIYVYELFESHKPIMYANMPDIKTTLYLIRPILHLFI